MDEGGQGSAGEVGILGKHARAGDDDVHQVPSSDVGASPGTVGGAGDTRGTRRAPCQRWIAERGGEKRKGDRCAATEMEQRQGQGW